MQARALNNQEETLGQAITGVALWTPDINLYLHLPRSAQPCCALLCPVCVRANVSYEYEDRYVPVASPDLSARHIYSLTRFSGAGSETLAGAEVSSSTSSLSVLCTLLRIA